MGDFAAAISDYDEAICLHPDLASSYSRRAVMRRALGDLPGALKDHDRAVELNPSAIKHCLRAKARTESGDIVGAIADCDAAIALDSTFAGDQCSRAVLLLRTGDASGAALGFSRAIELDSQHAAAFVGRAHARRELGDMSGARDDWIMACRLEPGRKAAAATGGPLASLIASDLDLQGARVPVTSEKGEEVDAGVADLGPIRDKLEGEKPAPPLTETLLWSIESALTTWRGRALGEDSGIVSAFFGLQCSMQTCNKSALAEVAEVVNSLRDDPTPCKGMGVHEFVAI